PRLVRPGGAVRGCLAVLAGAVLAGLQRGDDGFGGPLADARQPRDLLGRRLAWRADGAEVPKQRRPPGTAQARHSVELADRERRAALFPVVGDCEPVRLVPHPLQQVQALAATRQDDRAVLARQPDFLQPLGQSADRDIDDAQLLQRLHCRADLAMAAVDHEQVRRVGEFPPGWWLAVDRGGGGISDCVALAGFVALLQVAPEPAADHLADGGDIIGAVQALDGEPAVLRLAGQAVLEHHHRCDHVSALQVGDVVALDPQRRVVEPERLLDLVQGAAAGGQVAGPPGLVQDQGLRRVPGDGLQQGLLVPALRRPEADPAAAACSEPLLDGRRLRRCYRHEDLARYRASPGRAARPLPARPAPPAPGGPPARRIPPGIAPAPPARPGRFLPARGPPRAAAEADPTAAGPVS